MSAALDAALEYHERGFAVIPLAHQTKVPDAGVLEEVHGDSRWGPFQERPPSVPEIREWFERRERLNLGVLTGPASNGLVVVDFDRAIDGLRHPATPSVKTSRGRHLYVRSPKPPGTKAFEWGEIRSNGAYVVAPPEHPPQWIGIPMGARPRRCSSRRPKSGCSPSSSWCG